MRKFVSIGLITLIIVSACTKQKELNAIDYEKVEEVLNFEGNLGARVIAFNILAPAEKAYAFKKHLQDSYGSLDLSQVQVDYIKSVIKQIVPEMYILELKEKYEGVLASFTHEGKGLFSPTDFVRLFANIQSIESNLSAKQFVTVDAPGDCYCAWQSTCQAYADTACPYCTDSSCTTTTTGCGFLWVSACKKKCGSIPPGDEEEPGPF